MSNNGVEVLESARAFIRREAAAIDQLAHSLDGSFLDVVHRVLATTGKVVTTGAGTSGIAAERLAHLLSVSGTPAFYLSGQDALHGGMGAITPTDTVIALSKTGQSAELTELVTRLAERAVHVIAVTGNSESPFARAAGSVALVETIPGDADPGGLIAMGSTLVAGAWGDALATTLMTVRGYPWHDVIHTHPAGYVGQQAQTADAHVQTAGAE
ncbi:SIS domain-containing protein [Cryobacterium glaciale]|uniref:SIS domain-containing protein n=1 Tax=Cryobacterium glaciale TaxID=1259145 RepID=A0A4R8UZV6_9MICO|nr:SIS domain-containing protein [Cryobacterium glaciale]TFB75393.1 SIS domain-containing protein [Cryobacterium glaciale]